MFRYTIDLHEFDGLAIDCLLRYTFTDTAHCEWPHLNDACELGQRFGDETFIALIEKFRKSCYPALTCQNMFLQLRTAISKSNTPGQE